jgi:hypothetical protein
MIVFQDVMSWVSRIFLTLRKKFSPLISVQILIRFAPKVEATNSSETLSKITRLCTPEDNKFQSKRIYCSAEEKSVVD